MTFTFFSRCPLCQGMMESGSLTSVVVVSEKLPFGNMSQLFQSRTGSQIFSMLSLHSSFALIESKMRKLMGLLSYSTCLRVRSATICAYAFPVLICLKAQGPSLKRQGAGRILPISFSLSLSPLPCEPMQGKPQSRYSMSHKLSNSF